MLGEILEAVKGLEGRVTRIESGTTKKDEGGDTTKVTKRASIKEFLIEHSPSDGVQMTLAIGYYMEMQEGMESFNKADLEKGFRAAKEKPPVNINDKVNMCIKNGHMMEAESKKDSMKAWVLTRSGEDMVRQGFKKDPTR